MELEDGSLFGWLAQEKNPCCPTNIFTMFHNQLELTRGSVLKVDAGTGGTKRRCDVRAAGGRYGLSSDASWDRKLCITMYIFMDKQDVSSAHSGPDQRRALSSAPVTADQPVLLTSGGFHAELTSDEFMSVFQNVGKHI